MLLGSLSGFEVALDDLPPDAEAPEYLRELRQRIRHIRSYEACNPSRGVPASDYELMAMCQLSLLAHDDSLTSYLSHVRAVQRMAPQLPQSGPATPQSSAQPRSLGFPRQQQPVVPYTPCPNCGGMGHWKKDCPAASFQPYGGVPAPSAKRQRGPPAFAFAPPTGPPAWPPAPPQGWPPAQGPPPYFTNMQPPQR
jgi:hypothetical protein